MSFRLEHANLCVRDIDNMIRFLRTAFPEIRFCAGQRLQWRRKGDLFRRMNFTEGIAAAVGLLVFRLAGFRLVHVSQA